MTVVDVVLVLHGLTAVTGCVRPLMPGVDAHLLAMLVPVHMIHVVTVLDGLTAVAREVLVVHDLGVLVCHEKKSAGVRSTVRPPHSAGHVVGRTSRRGRAGGSAGEVAQHAPTGELARRTDHTATRMRS
jgi:hypothetical protein